MHTDTIRCITISNVIYTLRYKISELKDENGYEVDLSFQTNLEGVVVDYPLLSQTRIPLPLCVGNFTKLPGDGTVDGFREELGETAGRTAINLVLAHLGLGVSFEGNYQHWNYINFMKVIITFLNHRDYNNYATHWDTLT